MKLFTKKKLGILLLLLTVAAGFFIFQYFSSAFDEKDLKGIQVQLVQDNTVTQSNTEEYFVLSPKDRALLSLALDTVKRGDFKPEITHQYELLLRNRLGFPREYTLLFAENETVFLQDQQSRQVVQVAEPDFFFSHPGFYHIYADRLEPVLQVTLNEDPVLYSIADLQWSYLRYDGQWNIQGFEDNKELASKKSVSLFSSDDQLAIQTDKKPDQAHLTIMELATGKMVFQGEVEDLGQLPLPNINGSFQYQMTLDWLDETKPYRGQFVLDIPVVLDFPEKFVFSKQRIIQGELLEVALYYGDHLEDIIFEQSIYEGFRWYNQGGIMRGYLPTNFSTKPGTYKIKCGNSQKGTEFIQEIEVVAHTYRIQHLTISPQIAESTRNDAAYAEFAKYFTPVRKESAPSRYYTEPFIMPTQGRLTTEFGQTRYVNGAPTSYRHSGLDIAAPTGTEVRATNSGKVVLAMPLILTGNSIIVDHGEGLFSVYYHMHENLVSTGDMVERGQKIATVGTTGFSTGPHLHFTMSYYLMNIEPGFFIVGQPITTGNYREFMQ